MTVMANLEPVLHWLGLAQYYDRFMQAGFDSWETLLEITEGDLEILDVDLGHRRKLQREIMNTKNLAAQQGFLYSQPQQQSMQAYLPPQPPVLTTTTMGEDLEAHSSTQPSTSAKRAYKHHPKSDTNSPARPYSAYVLFSNHMREVLKADNLDFPEISRQVGQRWQTLSSEEKEFWKQEAVGPWEQYKADLGAYQATDQYSVYKTYLEKFKAQQTAKDAGPRGHKSRYSSGAAVATAPVPAGVNEVSTYPTPGQTPASTTKAFSSSSMASNAVLTVHPLEISSPSEGKMPIVRLKRDDSLREKDEDSRRPKSKQACEPCRRKKTKCDEARPTCGHCVELHLECVYADSKRDQEKRRLSNLSRKLDECQKLLRQVKPQLEANAQHLIQEALEMSPQLKERQSSPNPLPSQITPQASPLEDAESSDEEASGLGLSGTTHDASEREYAGTGTDSPPRAFAGQSSDVQWMQKLASELIPVGVAHDQSQQPLPSLTYPNGFAEDFEASIVGNNVDPVGLPVKQTADALVKGYFATVHVSFPVLDKTTFMRQYSQLASIWHKPETFKDRMFMPILQLVLAIGAVHAHLSGTDGVSDDRDHYLYFARARMLGSEHGVFNDQVHLTQVQVFGLGAMYLLITDQMNRSWNSSGLAIRSAQALGLHLRNISSSASTEKDASLAYTWFALVAFDQTLGMMTGRPSMVHERDCSVSLPGQGIVALSSGSSQSGETHAKSSPKTMDSRMSSAAKSALTQASLQSGSLPCNRPVAIEATFFKYHVELTSLAHDVVSQLYAPAIRQQKWSRVQAMIDSFDERLVAWKSGLKSPFGGPVNQPGQDPLTSSFNIIIAIQFQCVRSIINRPLLCRHDRTNFEQSSRNALSRCVGSARAVIDLILTSPPTILLHQGPKWWLLLHHMKRALTVLLLELAFRAEHTPSEAEELLDEAKHAIEWLRKTASSSATAQHIWVTMSRLLHLAAKRVGFDIGDFGMVDENDLPSWLRYPDVAESHAQQLTSQSTMSDPRPAQLINLASYNSDLNPSAFDDFVPYANNPFQNQEQAAGNFLGEGAFDEFSFEPTPAALPERPPFSHGGYPAAMLGGQHAASSSNMMLQRPGGHQHGIGVRGDGYMANDYFGFDISGAS